MKNLNLRTSTLALSGCLALGLSSCSTTHQLAATSQGKQSKTYSGRSIAKYIADGTLETTGNVLGAGGLGFVSVIYFIGGLGYGFDGTTPPWE